MFWSLILFLDQWFWFVSLNAGSHLCFRCLETLPLEEYMDVKKWGQTGQTKHAGNRVIRLEKNTDDIIHVKKNDLGVAGRISSFPEMLFRLRSWFVLLLQVCATFTAFNVEEIRGGLIATVSELYLWTETRCWWPIETVWQVVEHLDFLRSRPSLYSIQRPPSAFWKSQSLRQKGPAQTLPA